MDINIRTIQPGDNAAIARIIRQTLEEFGANHAGTVYFDTTTDALFELFQQQNSIYHIAELNGTIVGGGGIFPTEGLPPDTCELVKMYLLPEARGKGIGGRLITACLDKAAQFGFTKVYLETMSELKAAMKVYESMGFTYLGSPMGNTGHFGCPLWMLKVL
jgi:putative acetyltransferase